MNQRHIDGIKKYHSELVELTKYPEELLELLLQRGVIDNVIKKIIEGKPKEERVDFIYKMITTRGANAYYDFTKILRETGNEEASLLLNKNKLYYYGHSTEDGLPDNVNEVYELNSIPKGRVLIVNIFTYEHGLHETRDGSKADVANLQELWKHLGHSVTTFHDLTKHEFEEKFKQFIDDPTFVEDCFTLICMSHGEGNKGENLQIFMHDNKYVDSTWMLDQLTAAKAPHLAEKPKLIIFVSCRGNLFDWGTDIVRAEEFRQSRFTQNDGIVNNYQPSLANIAVVYPCSVGQVSPRDVKYGSHFVQEMIEVFRYKAAKDDVKTMFEEVGRNLYTRSKRSGIPFQTVCVNTVSFNKKLYYLPMS